MVKKKTARQKVQSKLGREEAVADDHENVEREEDVALPAGKSAQRRLAKKLNFHKRLITTKEVLSANRILQKPKKRKGKRIGLALESLSTLVKDLPTDPNGKQRQPKVLRSKARQELTTQETKQLAAVLGHPSFKANPFDAIKQHLTNTLPPAPSPPKQKWPKDAKRKRQKKKKSGESNDLGVEMDTL